MLYPDTLFRLRDHANWGGGRLRNLGSSGPSPLRPTCFWLRLRHSEVWDLDEERSRLASLMARHNLNIGQRGTIAFSR
jgi:hypothetical protein